jgi:hypothetical protein
MFTLRHFIRLQLLLYRLHLCVARRQRFLEYILHHQCLPQIMALPLLVQATTASLHARVRQRNLTNLVLFVVIIN